MVAPNEVPMDPEASAPDGPARGDASRRRGVGVWGILLVLVVVFGYLTPERRAALVRLAEQIADIIGDFRGYDPEF